MSRNLDTSTQQSVWTKTYLFGTIPQFETAHVVIRACWEEHFEGESEDAVDMLDKVEGSFDFLRNLQIGTWRAWDSGEIAQSQAFFYWKLR